MKAFSILPQGPSAQGPFDQGPTDNDNLVMQIVNGIATQGYVVVDHPWLSRLAEPLFMDLQNTHQQAFKPAGVGRAEDFQVNQFTRRDSICWLERDWPPAQDYFAWMESLRLGLNRALFLGLFDYECHYARYPQGAFYKTHVDAFRGRSNRRLSTVFYLNPHWQAHQGGELVIYRENSTEVLETVSPRWGRLVIFLSEVFPHQVLPATRERVSLTGWFRINTSLGPVIDPAQ